MPKSGNFSPAFLGSLTPATTLSNEELTDHLIDLKILNQNGEPKKKYVKQEVFDDEGHIKHRDDFYQLVSDKQDEFINTL